MNEILKYAKRLYSLSRYRCKKVKDHEGGRNTIYLCQRNGENVYVLRFSNNTDRCEDGYLAETEFVHYLANNGASVADVVFSTKGNMVEKLVVGDKTYFISLFAYAKGMMICDNGYRYREKAPLSEYFYNTGKTLGHIHHLSKQYQPNHKRFDYFDVFNVEYINKLIPSTYVELKDAIIKRWDMLSLLDKSNDNYGLVHFDFNDGNYHIDMDNGDITVFDFDNSLYCWYMYDLAQLWIGGTGWIAHEKDNNKRKDFMCEYFQKIMEGYRNETNMTEDETIAIVY